jgi:hypothetical protein
VPPLGYKCFSIRRLESSSSPQQRHLLNTKDTNSPQQRRPHTKELKEGVTGYVQDAQDTRYLQKLDKKDTSSPQQRRLPAESYVNKVQQIREDSKGPGQIVTPTGVNTKRKENSAGKHSTDVQDGVYVTSWESGAGWHDCGGPHKNSESEINSDRNSDADRLRLEGTTLLVNMPRSGGDHSDRTRSTEWSEKVEIEMRMARSCADGGRCSGPYVLRSSFTNAIWVRALVACVHVHMCIYAHTHMNYVYTYIYIYIYIYIHTQIRINAHTHTYTHTHIHTYARVHIHTQRERER